tara:strand:- start:744 stop:1319 length:576 start_codon:yes stop_codon:yes gene_type:complete
MINIPYYYFNNVFSDKECDDIIKLGENSLLEDGKTKGEDKSHRNNKVAWINDKCIFDKLNVHMNEANKKAGWNFDIDYMESLQFSKYDIDGHYDWHTDGYADTLSVYKNQANENYNGKVRKISMTLNLSSPKDYDGGDLLFDFAHFGEKKVKENLRGSLIFFPSWTFHKITPITKGVRYSLVMWSLGAPIK